jgi:RNA polymerase sigma factor for flagellar operon FliA
MQQVLALYYCEDLNLKEIGHVLGVTESRVCQLHGEATKRLAELSRRVVHGGSGCLIAPA